MTETKHTDKQPTEQPGKLTRFNLRLIEILSVAFILFQTIVMVWGIIPVIPLRTVHAAFVLALAFLIYDRFSPKLASPPWLNYLLALVGVTASAFAGASYQRYFNMITPMTTTDFILGILVVIVVLEACRRAVGWTLPVLAFLSIVYALFGSLVPGFWGFRGMSLFGLIETLYAGVEGLWGGITGISATIVASFLIFGGILVATGSGKVFIDIGLLLSGRSVGGAAKVAAVSSSLFGTVSGSSISNVILSGQFTIPMMKKSGYTGEMAAAVESVASTGGSIMPPIMGTGAFVMAQLLGVPYINIVLAAIIPAVLYYVGLISQIHFEAARAKRTPLEARSETKGLLTRTLFLAIPLALLLTLLLNGYSETYAVFWTLIVTVFIQLFASSINANREPKPLMTIIQETTQSFVQIARTVILVGSILMTAAIIVTVLQQTGIAVKAGAMLVSLAGNNLVGVLLIAMIFTILLGMGLPAVVAYVIAAIILAGPAQDLGLSPLVAHMFIFYFSVLSAITPPVCTATYAAASLAQANWIKTGLIGVKLAGAGFIIPFMFAYSPALLLEGAWIEIVRASITSFSGVLFLAAGIEGYFLRSLGYLPRLFVALGGVLLIAPDLLTDLIGVSFILLGIVLSAIARKGGIALASKN